MSKYIQNYIITNDAMDINYRLRPISVIMYFQDCFARYMTKNNLAAFDIADKDLYWVIAGFNIEFKDELPFWSEEIEVASWLSEVSKLKIYSDFELKHNGKIFASGDACWFILNSNTKRPHTTARLFDNIKTTEEYSLGEHKKFTLPDLKEEITSVVHQTNLSDIDFNNHVNNKSYLNLVETTADENFKNSHVLKKLSVKYNKESYLGDILTCIAYKTGASNSYFHKITKNNVSVCEVITRWEECSKRNKITDCNLAVRK